MATQSSPASAAPKRHRDPVLELKPVFGEGRSARWEAVKKIFRERIVPLYGDQSDLLKTVEEKNGLRCRLLEEDESPVGVVIYSIELSRMFEREGCLEIKALYAHDQSSVDGPKHLTAFLLNEVLERGRELKARSLIIKVSKTAQIFKFFQDNHFVSIRDRESFAWLCRNVEDKTPEKDEREPEKNVEPAKRARTEARSPAYPPPPPTYYGPNYDNRSAEPSGYPPLVSARKLAEKPRIDECPIMLKYFNMIRNGTKTIEVRTNNYPFTNWDVDTLIRFKNQNQFVLCKVTKIVRYTDFETMLQKEGVSPCLPDVYSVGEAVRIYRNIPRYAEKERQVGVLAIHIAVCLT